MEWRIKATKTQSQLRWHETFALERNSYNHSAFSEPHGHPVVVSREQGLEMRRTGRVADQQHLPDWELLANKTVAI